MAQDCKFSLAVVIPNLKEKENAITRVLLHKGIRVLCLWSVAELP